MEAHLSCDDVSADAELLLHFRGGSSLNRYIYVYMYIFIYMNGIRSSIRVYMIYTGGTLDVSVDDGPLLRVEIVQAGKDFFISMNGIRSSIRVKIIYIRGAPRLRRHIHRASSPLQRWVISQQIYVYMCICIYMNVIRSSIRV